MKFVDEALITVQSGNGGRGCVSFKREKFIEFGGPDGGDGGKGGDVVIKTSSQKRTLYNFRHQKLIRAENGKPGEGSNRYGRNGKDALIEIPVGTLVINSETGELIKDFTAPDETYVIAAGGMGGRGNKKFTTSTNKAPRHAQPGISGDMFQIKLELKLLADIGIIGFPSSGKSTLISVISSARPKIAAYPFTTLTPNIGMVESNYGEPFAVADIPGLIEGAHKGTGLGIKFLKHIERTKLLIHLIDATTIDSDNPLEKYHMINNELSLYSEKLAEKKQIIVINKMDVTGSSEKADLVKKELKDRETHVISAVTGNGIKQLVSMLSGEVSQLDK